MFPEKLRARLLRIRWLHSALTTLLDFRNRVQYARLSARTDMRARLEAYKGLHQGEQCYIIGNGPSLTAKDLEAIARNGYVTFASNRIYEIFGGTSWRPTYYLCQDVYDERLARFVISSKLPEVFVGIYFWSRWKLTDTRNIMVYNGQKSRKLRVFSEDFAHAVGEYATVTYSALQLAAYMGFSKIVLIGVDHAYSRTIDESGDIQEDMNVPDHFYSAPRVADSIANIAAMEDAYQMALQNLERREIEVVDATRGGALKVFPKIEFEQSL